MDHKTLFLKQKLNVRHTANKEQVSEITQRVKREASLRKWSISDDVLEIVARDVLDSN